MKLILPLLLIFQILLTGCTSQEEKEYQEKRAEQKTALVHVAKTTWIINFKLTHRETGQELFQYATLKASNELEARQLLTSALGTSEDVTFEIIDVKMGQNIKTNSD